MVLKAIIYFCSGPEQRWAKTNKQTEKKKKTLSHAFWVGSVSCFACLQCGQQQYSVDIFIDSSVKSLCTKLFGDWPAVTFVNALPITELCLCKQTHCSRICCTCRVEKRKVSISRALALLRNIILKHTQRKRLSLLS